MSEAEIKLFQPLKEFKILSVTVDMLENIRELQSAREIILK